MNISIDEILRTRAPRIRRWIPRGAVRRVERLVRQKELNHVLETYAGAAPMEFLRGFFDYAGVTFEAVGLDELPRGKKYIFASNHPFGGMDGMMLAEVIGARFGDVRVVVNDLLMYLEPLRPIFVPVNKSGAQRAENARAMAVAFAGAAPVLTFPAGLCSRREGGVVCDVDWRPNFVKRAVQNDRAVVPVYVEGRLSERFYRTAALRKKLGLRVNVEQILLPGEMFAQKGRHFRLIFGTPIPPSELAAFGDNFAAAQAVKIRAYALQNNS